MTSSGAARFQRLTDEVRQELARSFIAHSDLALLEVALLLGFSDQSSFTRSFKRWTGTTPAAYRALARDEKVGLLKPSPVLR